MTLVSPLPLVTLLLIEFYGWRAAFFIPGAICFVTGIAYALFLRAGPDVEEVSAEKKAAIDAAVLDLDRKTLIRVFGIIFFTAAIGSFIFQSTTFALPKIFDERLAGFATSGSEVGMWAFIVFAIASIAQLAVGYMVDRYSVRYVFAFVAFHNPYFLPDADLTGINALIVKSASAVFGQTH